MEHDESQPGSVDAETQTEAAVTLSEGDDGLLDRIGLIESQPLDQRARGFEQLHDELLAELQRSDHEGA